MVCPKCNSNLGDTHYKFCPYCSVELRTVQTQFADIVYRDGKYMSLEDRVQQLNSGKGNRKNAIRPITQSGEYIDEQKPEPVPPVNQTSTESHQYNNQNTYQGKTTVRPAASNSQNPIIHADDSGMSFSGSGMVHSGNYNNGNPPPKKKKHTVLIIVVIILVLGGIAGTVLSKVASNIDFSGVTSHLSGNFQPPSLENFTPNKGISTSELMDKYIPLMEDESNPHGSAERILVPGEYTDAADYSLYYISCNAADDVVEIKLAAKIPDTVQFNMINDLDVGDIIHVFSDGEEISLKSSLKGAFPVDSILQFTVKIKTSDIVQPCYFTFLNDAILFDISPVEPASEDLENTEIE